jgi:hypothetical protein
MFIVPRTPEKRRLRARQPIDIYDQFIDTYLTADTLNKSILIEVIVEFVENPVYTHLFNTMNADNVHHIMGYLRSQQSVKMNFILNHLLHNNGGGSNN